MYRQRPLRVEAAVDYHEIEGFRVPSPGSGSWSFDPLTDILFRPCIRTPKQGAATAVSLLLDERWKEVTGQMFASCKPKKVKDKFMNHPQARQLWADTKAYLEKLKLEEPIG